MKNHKSFYIYNKDIYSPMAFQRLIEISRMRCKILSYAIKWPPLQIQLQQQHYKTPMNNEKLTFCSIVAKTNTENKINYLLES